MKNILSILVILFLPNFIFSQQKDSLQKKIDSLEVKLLKEVTVENKNKLFEQKIDRLIFNVENSIQATGGDAIDAIKSAPRIQIQNNEIKMFGKSNLMIMIDDKIIRLSGENLINYLKNIPSSYIKSIEIITTPPAKYEAEGNSGIINIITRNIKKNQWNILLRNYYEQGRKAKFNQGINFTIQKNKITVSSDFNFFNAKWLGIFRETYFYPNSIWKSNEEHLSNYSSISGKFNFNYKFNKKINLGFQYNFDSNNGNGLDDNKTKFMTLNNELDSLLLSKSYDDSNIHNHSLNLYSIIKLDTLGKKINIDLDYFSHFNKMNNLIDSKNTLIDNSLTGTFFKVLNNNDFQVENYSANIDMEYPTKFAKYNFGGKYLLNEINNNFNVFKNAIILDTNQSNLFIYKEYRQSLFFSVEKKLSEKWSTQIGLRFENTQTNGESVTLKTTNKFNYENLFPTFYLTYIPNSNHTFNITYNKRIQRPNYWQLNPFKRYWTGNTYSQGNPFLLPQYNHKLELTYTYKELLNTWLFFNRNEQVIAQYFVPEQNETVLVYLHQNLLTWNEIGISQQVNLKPFKWLKSVINGAIYHSKSYSNNPNITTFSGWGGNTSVNNYLQLNNSKTLRAEINFWYDLPTYSGIEFKNGLTGLNSGINYNPKNDKFNIGLYFNNILGNPSYLAESISNNIINKKQYFQDIQYVRFSFTYKFGNKNLYENQRESKNQEEKNRIGSSK